MMQIQLLSHLLQSLPLNLDDPLVQPVQWASENGWIDKDHWSLAYDTEQAVWLSFRPLPVDVPDQGWKLHITADALSAETVLRRVLPILLQERVAFKYVVSLEKLQKLNGGLLGASQIGKFLTVYPKGDDEAVRLAALLDESTRGLSGPRIPSDRMLRPGSLVFYRYGGFTNKTHIQELLGTVWPALRMPDDSLIPDTRGLKYRAPNQRVDPFVSSGTALDLPKNKSILAQRYLLLSHISTTVNHIISLAIDLESQRTCIVKGQGRLWQGSLPGEERQRALQEAQALRALQGYQRVPELYDVVEQQDTIALILSDIPGQSLMEFLVKEQKQRLTPLEQGIAWGRELAEILEVIHNKGFVFADIKPTNVIIGPDEKLYLIDFELTIQQNGKEKDPHGTRGYMSPQQLAGEPASVRDDIYSFGALLYLLVTGAESSQAPDPMDLLKRSVEDLRPETPPALIAIIKKCLQKEPEARYASMGEVIKALDALTDQSSALPLETEPAMSAAVSTAAAAHAREIARNVLQTLCEKASETREGASLPWKTTHPLANSYALRDVNAGLAGAVLAFAGLAGELEAPEALSVLAQSASWLQSMPPHSDPPLAGLYVGEAGVGTALLWAGRVLGAPSLIDAALECGRLVARQPQLSPDVIHGTAGRLLFHLLLWEETGCQEQLDAALACGEYLLETAQTREAGEVCWTIPAEFKVFDPEAYAGYAHGVAGIADALLDLFEATGDERFIPSIQGASRWLQRLAIPVLPDQSGLAWPATEGQSAPSSPFWCHGATGVGRFFLHASRHAWLPGTREIAFQAAESVIHLGKSSGPSLCHGLAGNCEFLLDLYQETGLPRYLAEAQTFGRLLEAFAVEQEGRLVFHGDQSNVFSPDYLVGYAGIAITFLRLSDPTHLPAQLSRSALQAYKKQARG